MIYIIITKYIYKHCVVAYEVAEVTYFFIVLPEGGEGKRPFRSILNFSIFRKNARWNILV